MNHTKFRDFKRRRWATILLKNAANEHSKKLAQKLIDSWLAEQRAELATMPEDDIAAGGEHVVTEGFMLDN